MTTSLCPREDELLDGLAAGFIGAELESHVAACSSCSELRLVAGAVLDDRAVAMMEAPIPASGTVWWRMQLRHRQEAQALARRSLIIGQAVTLATALTLLLTFFGLDLAFEAREAIASIHLSTPVLLALAASVLGAPIAGLVAIRQK
jgi:hypothetical protein